MWWIWVAIFIISSSLVLFLSGIVELLCFYIKPSSDISLKIKNRRMVGAHQVELELIAAHRFRKLPPALPGQHLILKVPIGKLNKQRCYSIASYSTKNKHYKLLVKREANGFCSRIIVDKFRVGQTIKSSPPSGRFQFKLSGKQSIVLIAGGVGITPMRALWEYFIAHKITSTQLYLFYAAKQLEDFYKFDEFCKEASLFANLNFFPFSSNIDNHNVILKGRIDMQAIASIVPCTFNADYYLCASKPMMNDIICQLTKAGIADENIYFEDFAGVQVTGKNAYFVSIDNKTFEYSGSGTLLTLLEEQNMPIQSACKTGNCGLCKAKLLKGKVSYIVNPECRLCIDEILPCCCYPKEDVLIELKA